MAQFVDTSAAANSRILSAPVPLTAQSRISAAVNALGYDIDGTLYEGLDVPAQGGIGLPGFNHYTETPLRDLMKSANEWSPLPSANYAFNDAVKYDADGYPIPTVSEPRWTCVVGDSITPVGAGSGTLATLYTGVPLRLVWTGTPLPNLSDAFLAGASATSQGTFAGDPNRHWCEWPMTAPASALLDLRDMDQWTFTKGCLVPASVAADYEVHPWDAEAYKAMPLTSLFKPEFLTRIANVRVLRFMDTMNTNLNDNDQEHAGMGVNQRTWSHEAMWPANAAKQPVGWNGPVSAPWEFLLWMCGALGKIGWLHLPPRYINHAASVTAFADAIKAHYTEPTIYIEIGNEPWNPAAAFGNTTWLNANGPNPADPTYLADHCGNVAYNASTLIDQLRPQIEPQVRMTGIVGVQTEYGGNGLRTVYTIGGAGSNLPPGPSYVFDALALSAYVGDSAVNGDKTSQFLLPLAAAVVAGDTFLDYRTAIGVSAHVDFPDATVITQAVAISIIDKELRDGSVASNETGGTIGIPHHMAANLTNYANQRSVAGSIPFVIYEGNIHMAMIVGNADAVALLDAYHRSAEAGATMAAYLAGITDTTDVHCAFLGWGGGASSWRLDGGGDANYFALSRLLGETSANYPIFAAYEAFFAGQIPTYNAGQNIRLVGLAPPSGTRTATLLDENGAVIEDPDGWVVTAVAAQAVFHEFTPWSAPSAGTNQQIPFPPTTENGQKLICALAWDGGGRTVAWPGGWTTLTTQANWDGANMGASVAEYICDGTEGGTTFQVVLSSSEPMSAVIARYSSAGAVEAVASITSEATQLSLGAITPAAGVGDYDVAFFATHDSGAETVSTYPANYVNTGHEANGLNGHQGMAYGRRALTAMTTEDPGDVTIGSPESGVGFTVAVAGDAGSVAPAWDTEPPASVDINYNASGTVLDVGALTSNATSYEMAPSVAGLSIDAGTGVLSSDGGGAPGLYGVTITLNGVEPRVVAVAMNLTTPATIFQGAGTYGPTSGDPDNIFKDLVPQPAGQFDTWEFLPNTEFTLTPLAGGQWTAVDSGAVAAEGDYDLDVRWMNRTSGTVTNFTYVLTVGTAAANTPPNFSVSPTYSSTATSITASAIGTDAEDASLAHALTLFPLGAAFSADDVMNGTGNAVFHQSVVVANGVPSTLLITGLPPSTGAQTNSYQVAYGVRDSGPLITTVTLADLTMPRVVIRQGDGTSGGRGVYDTDSGTALPITSANIDIRLFDDATGAMLQDWTTVTTDTLGELTLDVPAEPGASILMVGRRGTQRSSDLLTAESF